MSFLTWFDNRTLLACDFLLASVFTIVLFGMKRVYPNLRGANLVSLSFMLGIPGAFLLASDSVANSPLLAAFANAILFASYIALYLGILRFIESRRSPFVPGVASFVALVVIYHSSGINQNIVPGVVVASAVMGLIRGLIAAELFRKAPGSTSPAVMRLFGASMFLFAAVSFNRAIMSVLHGAATSFLETDFIQTTSLALGVVSVCLTGIFFLVLASSELIERTRNESQRDQLSGALNRRGIEDKLGAELKHVARGTQSLSIALIDIDRFKNINDDHGHAAGDMAIRNVTKAMAGRLRRYDSLGRYGGDEFLLVLPHTLSSNATVIADRLNRAVALLSAESPFLITLSIGITEAVASDDTFSLIARADKALYKAKTDGRNCHRILLKGTLLSGVVESAEQAAGSPSLAGLQMPSTESGMLQQ